MFTGENQLQVEADVTCFHNQQFVIGTFTYRYQSFSIDCEYLIVLETRAHIGGDLHFYTLWRLRMDR